MQLNVAGGQVLCAVCSGADFSRRYLNGTRGWVLMRKRGFSLAGPRKAALFYACDRCSYLLTFAGDAPESPQETEP